jgi:hypothetical protein
MDGIENSPYWAVVAEWVRIILTLPDPPPEQVGYANDVVITTAIAALTARLSPQVGSAMRKSLAPVVRNVLPPAERLFS